MSRARIEWSHLLVEGLVIVVSILLAFGIDAWWDEQQQAEEAAHQVTRVITELESNIARLEMQVEHLDFTIDKGKRFLGYFGPDPAPVEESELAVLVGGIFSSGTLALSRSASTEFLASGQLTRDRWQAIRYRLTELMSYQDNSERRSVELRGMRGPLGDHLARLVPALNTTLSHEVMADYERSKFPYDSSVVFSDMYFEGLVGDFAIRMEINRAGHRELVELHREVLAEIMAGRDR